MPSITISNVNNFACQGINLEIHDRELLVILGPNGSGKTTLLNVIAGLVDYRGSVLFDGNPVDKIIASKREVGYLFQNLLLFPHLNVADNIAYGLNARRWHNSRVAERVKELLVLVNINHLASRYPGQLSGGEKQRVALARALASSPAVLLLDEPLSSLDTQTAKYLRTELKQIQRRLGITTIFVTHDLQEAEEMSDRIAVMQHGRMEQVGKPDEIFFYPQNDEVSDFIGRSNILNCDYCQNIGHGVMEVGCGGLNIIVPHDGEAIHRIAFLPQDIYITESKPPGPQVNRFKGTITAITRAYDSVRIGIRAGENNLLAEVPHHVFEELNLTTGKDVYLILKFRRIKIYEKKSLL